MNPFNSNVKIKNLEQNKQQNTNISVIINLCIIMMLLNILNKWYVTVVLNNHFIQTMLWYCEMYKKLNLNL